MRSMQQDDLSADLEPAVPGEDVSVALALVNTRLHGPAGPRDVLADPAGASAWLVRHGLAPEVGEGDDGRVYGEGGDDRWGDRLRGLRESIRALLAARIDDAVPDAADLATV